LLYDLAAWRWLLIGKDKPSVAPSVLAGMLLLGPKGKTNLPIKSLSAGFSSAAAPQRDEQ